MPDAGSRIRHTRLCRSRPRRSCLPSLPPVAGHGPISGDCTGKRAQCPIAVFLCPASTGREGKNRLGRVCVGDGFRTTPAPMRRAERTCPSTVSAPGSRCMTTTGAQRQSTPYPHKTKQRTQVHIVRCIMGTRLPRNPTSKSIQKEHHSLPDGGETLSECKTLQHKFLKMALDLHRTDT